MDKLHFVWWAYMNHLDNAFLLQCVELHPCTKIQSNAADMVPCMKSIRRSSKMLIFVYGTLKSGQPNHYLIEQDNRGHCKLIGKAVTFEKYPLVVASRHNVPYLLYKPGTGKNVQGEVYEVDNERLAVLDELESHPEYYERKHVEVSLLGEDKNSESRLVSVQAYFLVKYLEHLLELPMLESYYNEWNGLKYVLPSQRPPGKRCRHDVHKDYYEPDSS